MIIELNITHEFISYEVLFHDCQLNTSWKVKKKNLFIKNFNLSLEIIFNVNQITPKKSIKEFIF